MAVDAATINAKAEAAVAAIGAADWATARTRALEVQALLSAQPDSRIEGGMEMRWDRESIERLLKRIDREAAVAPANAAGGVHRTKINRVAVSD